MDDAHNLPLIKDNKNRNPTQRVKMKSFNPIPPHSFPVMEETQQFPLNLKKGPAEKSTMNSGPAMEDDVDISGIEDSSELGLNLFPKGKLSPHPIQPMQRQESDVASVLTKDKKISPMPSADAAKPAIIGINNGPGLNDVLTPKKVIIHSKSGVKRRNDMSGRMTGVPRADNQDEINKTRDVMEAADAFKKDPQAVYKFVPLEKGLGEQDLRECLQSPMVLISEGSFGQAYKASLNEGDVVVKKVKDVCVDYKEILTAYKLRHPGIVQMLAVVCVPGHFFIFMEYAGPSLKKWICQHRDNVKYLKANLMTFCKGLFSIVQWLEKHGTAHRDVKPENICIRIVSGKLVLKLIDFGSAQTKQDKPCLMGHTHEFLPPFLNYIIFLANTNQEFELGHHFLLQKCDSYAMALVVIWAWLGGQHPINDVNNYKMDCAETLKKQRITVMKKIMGLNDLFYEQFLALIPEPFRTALSHALGQDVKHRWDATQVCNYLDEQTSMSMQKKMKLQLDDSKVLDEFFNTYLPQSKGQSKIFTESPAVTQNALGVGMRKTTVQNPVITSVDNPILGNNANSQLLRNVSMRKPPDPFSGGTVTKALTDAAPVSKMAFDGRIPVTFRPGTQAPINNPETMDTHRKGGHISVFKETVPPQSSTAAFIKVSPSPAVWTNGPVATHQQLDVATGSKDSPDIGCFGLRNIMKTSTKISAAVLSPDKSQEPGLMDVMNIMAKTSTVTSAQEHNGRTQSMMGNIPNMSDILLDAGEKTGGGAGMSRNQRKVDVPSPQPIQQQSFHAEEEDFNLLPKLDVFEMGDIDFNDDDRQRPPTRRIAHGRRRSSNNKTMY